MHLSPHYYTGAQLSHHERLTGHSQDKVVVINNSCFVQRLDSTYVGRFDSNYTRLRLTSRETI